MESKRERVKDAIIEAALERGMTREEVYEDACDLADRICLALGISPKEQDVP